MNRQWFCKAFNHLSPDEIYMILRLRSEVFVVEQNCIFQDADNKDQGCLHCFCLQQNELIGCTRLAPAGYIYDEVSIGRVVTAAACRSKGLGKELMQFSIEKCRQYFGDSAIKIGAQYHLIKFYEEFGFEPIGAKYLEDGIEHVHMLRNAGSNGI